MHPPKASMPIVLSHFIMRRIIYDSSRSNNIFVRRPISIASSLIHSGYLSSMTHCAQIHEKDGSKDIGDEAWRKRLSPTEFRILRQKGTDPRHMHFDKHFESGVYHCAACNTALYASAMKFDCPCGWPAFYDCIPKAVREEADRDGMRVEILCNACNGHLGHVFRGEGFDNPAPNERHCVNSTSIKFVPSS